MPSEFERNYPHGAAVINGLLFMIVILCVFAGILSFGIELGRKQGITAALEACTMAITDPTAQLESEPAQGPST